MKTIPFVLILILVLLGVHVLDKPLSLSYEVIGTTILGHPVRMDNEGDSTPYIIVTDDIGEIRYTREGYLSKYNLKSKAIRCWN